MPGDEMRCSFSAQAAAAALFVGNLIGSLPPFFIDKVHVSFFFLLHSLTVGDQ